MTFVAIGKLLALFVSLVTAQAGGPIAIAQPGDAPVELLAFVEIPQGGGVKYEVDPASGLLEVDRFLSMPVVYPTNYGYLPSTLAGDGDPLDVLVITRSPLHPGVLIRVRAIAVLRSTDGGAQDDKVIAVPTEAVDPTYRTWRSLEDLAPLERERIAAFFRVYKQIPAGNKLVEVNGFGEAEEARAIVLRAMELYRARAGAGESDGSAR